MEMIVRTLALGRAVSKKRLWILRSGTMLDTRVRCRYGRGQVVARALFVLFCFLVLASCCAGDRWPFAVAKEWRDAAGVGLVRLVDEADVIVAASVGQSAACHSARARAVLSGRPEGTPLACGTLRVLQILRGDPFGKDIEVFYLDHRTSVGSSGLRRTPVGSDGSAGIYLLKRRGGHLWAAVAESRSYFVIDPQRYLPYSRKMRIGEAIAANLIGSNRWSRALNVDAGDTVLRVSEAIQLAGLDRVGADLERLTKSGEKEVAISVCLLTKSRLGGFVDCTPRLRRDYKLSAEEERMVAKADDEGEREIARMTKMLDGNRPIVLEGLLNSAPGGACEVVRWQLNHVVGSIRLLARARVEEVCRTGFESTR